MVETILSQACIIKRLPSPVVPLLRIINNLFRRCALIILSQVYVINRHNKTGEAASSSAQRVPCYTCTDNYIVFF